VDDYDQNYQYYMRDQYLELLWTAQKVEDLRLTELILQRLKDTALEMTVAPAPACEIIPFPSIIVHPSEPDSRRLLWPRQPLRHLVSMLCGYCVFVLFFGFFGIAA
jgi:hypothetical protein